MYKMYDVPYDRSDLEPHIAAEVLSPHYKKLYQGYVNGYNGAEIRMKEWRGGILRQHICYKNIQEDLTYQGSGAILHRLFFENLCPPEKALIAADEFLQLVQFIQRDFGSWDIFMQELTQAATSLRGNGWAVLAWIDEFKRLEILQIEGHNLMTMPGTRPILVLDMWEHAYYAQYGTDKLDYFNNLMKVINWRVAQARFKEIINE